MQVEDQWKRRKQYEVPIRNKAQHYTMWHELVCSIPQLNQKIGLRREGIHTRKSVTREKYIKPNGKRSKPGKSYGEKLISESKIGEKVIIYIKSSIDIVGFEIPHPDRFPLKDISVISENFYPLDAQII